MKHKKNLINYNNINISKKLLKKNRVFSKKIDSWLKANFVFLLDVFKDLKFQSFSNKTIFIDLVGKHLQSSEGHLAMVFNRNKFYLDLFNKSRSIKLGLTQAFLKYLVVKEFPLFKKVAMHLDNGLIPNIGNLKYLYSINTTSIDFVKTKRVKVQSKELKDNFLGKHRDDIYLPLYEDVLIIPQGLKPFAFKPVEIYHDFNKLHAGFFFPSAYILYDLNINLIWIQSWQSPKLNKDLDNVFFNEFMLKYFYILLNYKPIFPHVLAASAFLDGDLNMYFFDLYLMQLASAFSADELNLFASP